MKTTRQLLSEVSIPDDWTLSFEDAFATFPEAVQSWFHTVGTKADQRQFFVNDAGELGYTDHRRSEHVVIAYYWRDGAWKMSYA